MLVEDYPPKLGGGGMFVNSIAKELAADGERITVITPSYNGDSDRAEQTENKNCEIRVVRLGKRRISYFFKGILTLLTEPKFDIYHAHGPLPGLMAKIVSFVKGGRTVLHIHGFREENVIGKLKFMGQNAILKLGYDKIISVDSESAKRINEIGVPHDKVITIPCGVDTNLFVPLQGRKTNSVPVLLFVGRLEKVKGLNNLIDAIGILKASGINVLAYLIGSGTMEDELMAEAKNKGLDNIKFIKSVKHDELPDWYNKADLFVLPSISEGMPLVLLEAMACELPPVISNIKSLKTIAEKSNAAITFECGNAKSLAETIEEELDRTDSEKQKLKKNARDFAVKNYSWGNTIRMIKKAYNEVVSR